MKDADYILVDDRLEEMAEHYRDSHKYYYLVDEQLWFFCDAEAFRKMRRRLQSGFSPALGEDDLMYIEDRDQFVAMHARVFVEPRMDFDKAIEPFRLSRRYAVQG